MKLSFPSLDQIGAALLSIFKRFPFVILVSVVGTIAAIWLAELSYAEQDSYPEILALTICCGLGISFLFALSTFIEQKKWSSTATYFIRLAGLALIMVYWIVLDDQLKDGPYEVWYQFFLFALASHLFVAVAPFVSKGNVDQFWEYNKTLFLRILLSVLYSGVLFIGLSVALLALDNLLDLDIDGETYFQLFLFLGGIFNTWFFLTGVPEKEAILEKSAVFPTGLRVFVQYVLIPLVTVYIVILYLYLGKIILEWELPNGWVSNLVLTFSIAGILSLLLLYPIRDSKDYNWIRLYSRGYYLALIPLIGLLMLSIWIRISEYGVTINRYFVATLGVWLTGIVIYFILSKSRSIKVIPISLCLIVIGISFGPLGAFAVSERSQLGRFEDILIKNNLLDEQDKFIEASSEISFDDRKELSSVAYFIMENHGPENFGKYFGDRFTSEIDTINSANKLFALMGIEYVNRWESETSTNNYFVFSSEAVWAADVTEYNIHLHGVSLNNTYDSLKTVEGGNTEWVISLKNASELKLEAPNLKKTIQINLESIVSELRRKNFNENNRYSIPISEMKYDFENQELKISMYINSISGTDRNNVSLNNISADFFINIR